MMILWNRLMIQCKWLQSWWWNELLSLRKVRYVLILSCAFQPYDFHLSCRYRCFFIHILLQSVSLKWTYEPIWYVPIVHIFEVYVWCFLLRDAICIPLGAISTTYTTPHTHELWVLDYFICTNTGSCFDVKLRDNHTCIGNSLKNHCPICYEVS